MHLREELDLAGYRAPLASLAVLSRCQATTDARAAAVLTTLRAAPNSFGEQVYAVRERCLRRRSGG
eukprot:955884-Prymnesium_polylepis.1